MKDKVYIRIYGGLGNQLFQYAFGKAYSIKNNKELVLDNLSGFGTHDTYNRDFALDQFRIKEPLLKSKIVSKILGNRYFWAIGRRFGITTKEYNITKFDSKFIKNSKYLDGYWHSSKYFDKYKDVILKSLEIKNVKNKTILNNINLINKENQSVAIGLRFFQEVTVSGIHPVLNKDYYINAIEKVKEKIEEPHFFIFSNDKEKAEEFLYFLKNKTIIDPIKDNRGAIYDLLLMSKCNNFIISNSTFHWWGAYIGETKNSLVIAPKNGYYNKDMMCDNWEVL